MPKKRKYGRHRFGRWKEDSEGITYKVCYCGAQKMRNQNGHVSFICYASGNLRLPDPEECRFNPKS